MPDPLSTVSTRATPQDQPAAADQILNSGGGYVFGVSTAARVHRFLTLGVDGGTYYVSERDLTRDNAKVIIELARSEGEALVRQIVEVSTAGRAPRNNPALFALAAVAGLGDDAGRAAALAALPQVARTGTHLFQFVGYAEQFRGWGRGLRRAVGSWYLDRDLDGLMYQVAKYRQRGGWAQRDLLRLAKPVPDTAARSAVFRWVTKGDLHPVLHGTLLGAFADAHATRDPKQWTALIATHPLSWEMLPDEALGVPAVWEALLAKGMPMTALLRQLPRLTNLGLAQTGPAATMVTDQLTDGYRLRKGRVHPVNVLVAARTYSSGRGVRGTSSWTPARRIIDALDAAFYASFQAVEPSGKRTLLALDVSGSMDSPAGGLPITCREVVAAMALVTMATEPETEVIGFTGRVNGWHGGGRQDPRDVDVLSLSPRQRLDDACRYMASLPMGRTDCALPMLWAMAQRRDFDSIVTYTDNETWSGAIHPHQALDRYRQSTGLPTRNIVVAVTPTEFTIANPADTQSLDVSGFDSAVPGLIADFSAGRV
jgi:60 kDa SS-A/Ro ribonucleoprotein